MAQRGQKVAESAATGGRESVSALPLPSWLQGKPILLIVVGFTLAAALTFALSLIIARLAPRWGLLDRPEPRRIHNHPIPRLGGIAISASFLVVSLLLFRPADAYEQTVYIGLVLGSILIVAVMALDDVRGLPPLLRLGVQTLAALVVMFPGGHGTLIEVLHNPLISANHSQTSLPLVLAVPFTWFWIVGMMNTINWVDGVDGLAGGVVTIAAVVMAAISWILGQREVAVLCAVLAGATIGFLPLNWHPARLFMGDCGAMFLGLALAVLSNVGGAKLATILLLLGLPILDTARVIVRRLRKGRSPLHFDRSHLHHRLLIGGLTQRQIALLFYAVTAAFGGVTIIAASLQTRASVWAQHIHLFGRLTVAVGELPTLLGLPLVLLVSVGIFAIATVRRRRSGLPPGASSSVLPQPPQPPTRLSPTASGSHPRP